MQPMLAAWCTAAIFGIGRRLMLRKQSTILA